jgi:hypothetical protein
MYMSLGMADEQWYHMVIQSFNGRWGAVVETYPSAHVASVSNF